MAGLGLLLILIGVVLWLTILPSLGWILIVIGLILLVVGLLVGGVGFGGGRRW